MTPVNKEKFKLLWNMIAEDIHCIAKEKGWWDEERNDGELLALIHSEISEALEALRHNNKFDDKILSRKGVEVELADAVIRIMDLAQARDWDIVGAMFDKIAFNKYRTYKHGGKKF